MWIVELLVLAFAALVLVHAQSQDPLTDFCRRFSHQTAIIDNRLFIDGGYVVYGGQIEPTSRNVTNTHLLYADLRSVNKEAFPVQYSNLTKPNAVPSLAGGALWADTVNKKVFLYGGEYNGSQPLPARFTSWYFDTLDDTWYSSAYDANLDNINLAAYGASTVDNEKGKAYYYGGWSSNTTMLYHNGDRAMQSGLITYDLDRNLWDNTSFIDDTPRASGGLYYIPAGDAGMLVYFGGILISSNGTVSGGPMDTIYIFDIGSQRSYTQSTSGEPPEMRRRFCGGVSWPEDRSSYNIYIYGGLPPLNDEGIGFADAWILSLPSFTWTVYWPDDGNAHHSLSCNVVNQGQMMIIGGYWPNSSQTQCDVKPIWGMHNMDLGSINVAKAPWYQFLPNVTEYRVPANLSEVIGGSSTGNAAMTTPSGGFNDSDLATYFGRRAPTSTRTPTRAIATSTSGPEKPNSASSDHTGAIAGGVVGGVFGSILLAGIIFYAYRRRQKKPRTSTEPPMQQLDSTPVHREDQPPPVYSPGGVLLKRTPDEPPVEMMEQRRPQELPAAE